MAIHRSETYASTQVRKHLHFISSLYLGEEYLIDNDPLHKAEFFTNRPRDMLPKDMHITMRHRGVFFARKFSAASNEARTEADSMSSERWLRWFIDQVPMESMPAVRCLAKVAISAHREASNTCPQTSNTCQDDKPWGLVGAEFKHKYVHRSGLIEERWLSPNEVHMNLTFEDEVIQVVFEEKRSRAISSWIVTADVGAKPGLASNGPYTYMGFQRLTSVVIHSEIPAMAVRVYWDPDMPPHKLHQGWFNTFEYGARNMDRRFKALWRPEHQPASAHKKRFCSQHFVLRELLELDTYITIHHFDKAVCGKKALKDLRKSSKRALTWTFDIVDDITGDLWLSRPFSIIPASSDLDSQACETVQGYFDLVRKDI